MFIKDTLTQAYGAIRAQRLRAALIILAISIGVASVTVLTALGESARSYIVNEFESLGTHLVIVLPGRNETTGGHPPVSGETPRDLTLDDADALFRSHHIAAIAPLTIGSAPVSTKGLERETNIFGSTHALRRVRHLTMAQGSFLPEMDVNKAMPVCVIGQTIREELFADQPALGQWLRINDRRFRVMGVLASEGQSIGVDFDEMVIIPVASAQALFDTHSLFRILIETKSKESMYKAVDEINSIIKARHEGEDDITIITQDSVVSTFDKILTALTLTVVSIAGISLVVAGVLVMNVMLVSVTQRTAEVGLLKALGATNSQLHWLFLTEAAMLSLAGALLGIGLGQVTLATLAAAYPDFPIHLPGWALLAALGVSLFTGLVFGVLPARKAAKLNPIAALAKEIIMRSADLLSLSFRTITSHKLRSSLTALGLIIGIAAVVILTSIGLGIHTFVLAEFTQFGTNLVTVSPGKKSTFGLSGATISTVRPLGLADAVSLSKLENIIAVVPVVQGNARIEAGTKQRRTNVIGVGAAVPEVWRIKTVSGRFLPAGEQGNPRAFAVLGNKSASELFGSDSPLGKRIRIGSDRYRIIGVMEKKGQLLGFDMDDTIYIPIAKALELFDRESLMEIDLLYKGSASVTSVQKSIKRLLISRHGREDFTIVTQNQMLEKMDSILNILTLAVAALGSVSILVGSVGILTIMTIAVSERISEIGLLRALGAERRTIFQLFLCEALALSAAGGISGVLLGMSIVQILDTALPALPVEMAWTYIAMAFMVSIVIGIAAGVVPAMKAAHLEPLEALRTE